MKDHAWDIAFSVIAKGSCPVSVTKLADRVVFIDSSDVEKPRLMQIQLDQGQVPTPFGPPCSFHRPHHLSTSPDGGLLVTDTGNHRVMYLAPSAEEWTVVAGGRGSGSCTDQLCFPKATVAAEDGIIVADTNNHRVLRFFTGSTEGFIIAGGQGKGSRCDQLSGPCGIAMCHGGLLVADTLNNRLLHFAAGASQGRALLDKTVDMPVSLAVTEQGGVLVLEMHSHRVIHLPPGASRGKVVTSLLKFPQGLALDKYGNLLVADTQRHRIMYLPSREALRRMLFRTILFRALGANLLRKVASFL